MSFIKCTEYIKLMLYISKYPLFPSKHLALYDKNQENRLNEKIKTQVFIHLKVPVQFFMKGPK